MQLKSSPLSCILYHTFNFLSSPPIWRGKNGLLSITRLVHNLPLYYITLPHYCQAFPIGSEEKHWNLCWQELHQSPLSLSHIKTLTSVNGCLHSLQTNLSSNSARTSFLSVYREKPQLRHLINNFITPYI
jgi:hypothetical protein